MTVPIHTTVMLQTAKFPHLIIYGLDIIFNIVKQIFSTSFYKICHKKSFNIIKNTQSKNTQNTKITFLYLLDVGPRYILIWGRICYKKIEALSTKAMLINVQHK